MLDSSRPLRRDLLLLLLLLLPFFFALSGLRPLSVPDEGRYPEVAREMLLTGDFITPRVNGIVFLDKPALYYWLQAASFTLFGVNTWSVRFMPALFGVGGTLLVFATTCQLFSRRAAWLAAGALACSPLYYLSAHYANMDLEVALWVSSALCLFLLGRRTTPGTIAHQSLFLGAWAAVGCGILTKGLIGLLFPAMVLGVWVLVGWRWRELRHWHFISGGILVLLICLPWYLSVQQHNPQFFHYFFIYQQFERFSGGGFNNEFPVWFYVPVLLLGLLPWSLWLPKALYNQWRCAFGRDALADADSRQLLLLWPLLVFIFFSIPASKIAGYILPVIPPLCILLGDYLDRRLTLAAAAPSLALKIWPALPAGGAVLALGLLLYIPHTEKEGVLPLAEALQTHWQNGDRMVMYRTYPQDLPIYLQSREPLVFVDDWHDKRILEKDNWRREFYLGLENQPEARGWLINEKAFSALLSQPGRLFVFADIYDVPILQSRHPFRVVAQTKKNALLVRED